MNELTEKPTIFEKTIYRLPTIKELEEINDFQLSSNEILEGLKYTIVGRGIMSNKSKTQIIESISKLLEIDPKNNEYKIALNNAKNIKPKFIGENKLVGGKADDLTLNDLAKKYNVDVSVIKTQIDKGIKVELEHTNDIEKAREIATDHISEFVDYYDRLEKMENKAEYGLDENKTIIKKLVRENLKNK